MLQEMTSFIPTSCRTLGSTVSARTSVSTVCAGNEIPNWFCHQNEGSLITIKLPRNWYCTDFLGFAQSVVLHKYTYRKDLMFGCSCNFKTISGESHKTIYPSHYPFNEGERVITYSEFGHIFVRYTVCKPCGRGIPSISLCCCNALALQIVRGGEDPSHLPASIQVHVAKHIGKMSSLRIVYKDS
ncbi:hypothetical protein DVH24_010021 [Malus domestica]|uniref:C-JID domain-containing protein n=1 Tax=Malus domestica TaxID=3750 RepID=A0A498JRM6_MALDO|nr:hypothetical protein DVH24_010021 [Malus domestica]